VEYQKILSAALDHFSITSASRVMHVLPSIGLWMVLMMVFLWKLKNRNWAFRRFPNPRILPKTNREAVYGQLEERLLQGATTLHGN
jgi:hypothetical protein